MTSSPTPIGPAGPTVSGPTAVTTPAASAPSRIGSRAGSVPNAPLEDLTSTGLPPAALTSIRASPVPGLATGSSATDRTSGPPYAAAITTSATPAATSLPQPRFPAPGFRLNHPAPSRTPAGQRSVITLAVIRAAASE